MYRVIKASTSIRELIVELNSGINASGFIAKVVEDGKEIFKKRYDYGYNASYSRELARHSEKEQQDAIKYGWDRVPTPQPYVSDILTSLCDEYGIDHDDIVVTNGKNVFKGTQNSDKKVQDFIDTYLYGI